MLFIPFSFPYFLHLHRKSCKCEKKTKTKDLLSLYSSNNYILSMTKINLNKPLTFEVFINVIFKILDKTVLLIQAKQPFTFYITTINNNALIFHFSLSYKQTISRNHLLQEFIGILKEFLLKKPEGFEIYSKYFKNSAAVCFSDKIPTGRVETLRTPDDFFAILSLVYFNVFGQNFVTVANGSGILHEFRSQKQQTTLKVLNGKSKLATF